MTKKNYIAIANILRHYLVQEQNEPDVYYIPDVIDDLTKYFKEDNINFDKDKFVKACYSDYKL